MSENHTDEMQKWMNKFITHKKDEYMFLNLKPTETSPSGIMLRQKYQIYRGDMDEFYRLYSMAVENKQDLHYIQPLIHKQFGNSTCSQLNIDFDFKFIHTGGCLLPSQELCLYNDEFLFKLVKIVNSTIKLYLEPEEKDIYKIEELSMGFVLEKNKRVYEDRIYKNGFHIQYPKIYLTKEKYISFMKILQHKVNEEKQELELLLPKNIEMYNSSEGWVDTGVSQWLLYGSKKPDETYRYFLSRIIHKNGECEKVRIHKDQSKIIEYIKNELKYELEYAETEETIDLDKISIYETLTRLFHSFHLYRSNKSKICCNIKEEYSPIPIKRLKIEYQKQQWIDEEDVDEDNEVEVENEETSKGYSIPLRELELFIEKLDSKLSYQYNDWLNICWCIMNISWKCNYDKKDIKLLINNFSKKSTSKYNKYECDALVDKYNFDNNKEGYKFKKLFEYCINSNSSEDAYKQLQKIYNTYVKPKREEQKRKKELFQNLELYKNQQLYYKTYIKSPDDPNGYYMLDLLRDIEKLNNDGKQLMYEEYLQEFLPKLNKVLCKVIGLNSYVMKNSYKEQSLITKSIVNVRMVYWVEKKKKDGSIIKVQDSTRLENWLDNNLHYLSMYDMLDFNPDPQYKNNDRSLNIWTGFQAQLLSQNELKENLDKIDILLYHLKEVWCNGNQQHFDYLIGCYFKPMFIMPHNKNGVTVNIVGKQGTGKTIIIDDFLIPFVFGEDKSMATIGLNKITQKFNSCIMGKIFISVNELPTADMSKKDTFDTLKSLISDRRQTIEPKGINPFEINNYSRFIFCTNNDMSLYVEDGDRRYFVLQASDRHKNDTDYFYKLSKSFNQESANIFFSYCYYYNTTQNERIVPMTAIKQEMIINSAPNPIKFIHSITEHFERKDNLEFLEKLKNNRQEDSKEPLFYDVDIPDNSNYFNKLLMDIKLNYRIKTTTELWVSSTNLFDWYKSYCEEEKEKTYTQHKFSKIIKEKVCHKRITSGVVFNILDIRK